MANAILEIVEFRASGDVDILVASAAAMESWLNQQPGFRWRRLAKLDEGQFVDCIEWQDMAAAQAAAAAIMSAPAADAFMAQIDGTSLNMRHAEILIAQ
jgi:hypothetical protein